MTKITQKNYEAIKIYRQKEQIFELKGLVQRLGNNVEDLTLQKDLLIVENNNLRGLLIECRELFHSISEITNYAEVTVDDLLTRITAVIGESEK